MGYSDDAETGESNRESATTELLRPGEQSERSGWAAAAPSPEKYSYFFVPATSGDTADALAGDEFGALLRLGSYSDIEEAARDIRPQADLYPRHHLRDEGGAAAALPQASGGQQGIMLACDGRILLRSNEKMYVDTGDYDQYSSGNYDLEVNGTMRLATTGSPGGITISSAQDTLTLESGPDQDITINAGDGTGNINQRVKTETQFVFGGEYTYTDGIHRDYTLGSQFNFFAGGTFTFAMAGNLYTSAGDLFLRTGFFLFSIRADDLRVFYQDFTKLSIVKRDEEYVDSYFEIEDWDDSGINADYERVINTDNDRPIPSGTLKNEDAITYMLDANCSLTKRILASNKGLDIKKLENLIRSGKVKIEYQEYEGDMSELSNTQ